MRFYDIEITIPAEGASPERTIKYSSHKNGVYNPGALMIEFDILRYGESTPQGETHLTIWVLAQKKCSRLARISLAKKLKYSLG